jgi:ribonucleoside-diphosphate reductase alpha chain
MRRVELGANPDSPPHNVTLPATWSDSAAAALAGLAPGHGRVALPGAAEHWAGPVCERARAAGLYPGLPESLHRLLLERRGAPLPEIWRAEHTAVPGFVLNLPAFFHPGAGLDVQALADAVDLAATYLTLFDPAASRIGVTLADLDGLVAALGLDYDSVAGRDVAVGLAALLRGKADAASAAMAASFGPVAPPSADLPIPPLNEVPGLAEAARAALAEAAAAPALHHHATTCIADPGPSGALLGIATNGVAPAFAYVHPEGGLTWAARARLAARGMSAEAALASLLAGNNPLPLASPAAHTAMREAVRPYIQAMPPLAAEEPVAIRPWPAAERPTRRSSARDRAPLLPLDLPRMPRLPSGDRRFARPLAN